MTVPVAKTTSFITENSAAVCQSDLILQNFSHEINNFGLGIEWCYFRGKLQQRVQYEAKDSSHARAFCIRPYLV